MLISIKIFTGNLFQSKNLTEFLLYVNGYVLHVCLWSIKCYPVIKCCR